MPAGPYPSDRAERTRWILSQRPNFDVRRNGFDVDRPANWLLETEPVAPGMGLSTLTVFFRNRECPWRCLMCDLWNETTTTTIPPGAIHEQLNWTLHQVGDLQSIRQLKLYNAGSFFDPGAIPPGDIPLLVERCRSANFERWVVESHPLLVGERCRELRFQLPEETRLEVAMGLETVHPGVLGKLNKGMTLDDFRRAGRYLSDWGVTLRAFVLAQPPYLFADDSIRWGQRAIDFAFDCGARVVSIIPTRGGNGALEILAAQGEFSPPSVETVESIWAYGMGLRRGLVLVDTWDVARLVPDASAAAALRARWTSGNLRQALDGNWSLPI
jgi:radical SAM enzyme (TIGR01210 family)